MPFKKDPNQPDIWPRSQEGAPWYCSDLPEVGESVDVLVHENYSPGVVVRRNAAACKFDADLGYASEGALSPQVKTVSLDDARVSLAGLGAYGLFMGGTSVMAAHDRSERLEQHRQLLEDIGAEFDAKRSSPPPSSTYVGQTVESDGARQRCETELLFHEDGSVTGSGHDSDDGDYTIREGRWSPEGRVAWTESYRGYDVYVDGRVSRRGKISARFFSSRGISGDLKLEAGKPAVPGPQAPEEQEASSS